MPKDVPLKSIWSVVNILQNLNNVSLSSRAFYSNCLCCPSVSRKPIPTSDRLISAAELDFANQKSRFLSLRFMRLHRWIGVFNFRLSMLLQLIGFENDDQARSITPPTWWFLNPIWMENFPVSFFSAQMISRRFSSSPWIIFQYFSVVWSMIFISRFLKSVITVKASLDYQNVFDNVLVAERPTEYGCRR